MSSSSPKKPAERNPKFEWESAFIKSGITGNTGFIGLLMATYDNGDGRGFFISATQIAGMSGLNEKTVRTQIKTLREAGWIKRTRQGGNQGGRARASDYKLSYPSATTRSESTNDNKSQPDKVRSQPVTKTHPIDQYSLDSSSIDIYSLKEGDNVPTELISQINYPHRAWLVPDFDGIGMVYTPNAFGITHPPPQQQETPPPALDTRSEWRQQKSHEYSLREEGLDTNGEPLRKSY